MSIAELRKNRMAQGLSLTEISRRTRIGVTHLRHIEEGNFKSLPPGFYARAFVRAYAEAIGVDADIVLGELSDSLPATQAASSPAADSSPAGAAGLRSDAAELIPEAHAGAEATAQSPQRLGVDRAVESGRVGSDARHGAARPAPIPRRVD